VARSYHYSAGILNAIHSVENLPVPSNVNPVAAKRVDKETGRRLEENEDPLRAVTFTYRTHVAGDRNTPRMAFLRSRQIRHDPRRVGIAR
jgi:hypothetical protein